MIKNTHKTTFYAKEYWSGDSRDGQLVGGDGYHYYKLSALGVVQEAYEVYESDGGDVKVTPLPEMLNVNWKSDLGFDDFEQLEEVETEEFDYVADIYKSQQA